MSYVGAQRGFLLPAQWCGGERRPPQKRAPKALFGHPAKIAKRKSCNAAPSRLRSHGFYKRHYHGLRRAVQLDATPRGRSAWKRVRPTEPLVNANRSESLGLPRRDVEFGQKEAEPLAAGVD